MSRTPDDAPIVTLYHDPFAPICTVRQAVHADGGPLLHCDWCGSIRPRQWRYGTEHDDRPGRYDMDRHLFCSIGCYREYCA